MCYLTFSEDTVEFNNVVVGHLAHDAHLVLKLVPDFLGRVVSDHLHGNCQLIQLGSVNFSEIAYVCSSLLQ